MPVHVVSFRLALAVAIGSAVASPAWAGRFVVTTIDVPGVESTIPASVNDHDVVVGYTYNAAYANFVWANGTFTQVPPSSGSAIEWLNAINDRGFMLGQVDVSLPGGGVIFDPRTDSTAPLVVPSPYEVYGYAINSTNLVVGLAVIPGKHPVFAGYVAKNGHARLFSAPGGKKTTAAYAVNDAGQIAGLFGPAPQSGFVYDNGNYTTFAAPGGARMLISSISSVGVVYGSYFDAQDYRHGFTWDGTKFTTYDDPDGDGNTSLLGIGPQGQIYGNTGNFGFVYLDGTYYPFKVSVADTTTEITGFNAQGSIIGITQGGLTHGFIATCPPRHAPCVGIR